MYRCKYIHPTKKTYWQTVWADDINEASQAAKKWLRKGYQVMVSRGQYD